MWQPATEEMPFHGGCTYLERAFKADGTPKYIQAGSDYGHLHDEWFSRCATEEEAWAVFNDARALAAYLESLVPAERGKEEV